MELNDRPRPYQSGRCRLITEKARERLERKTEASVESRAEGLVVKGGTPYGDTDERELARFLGIMKVVGSSLFKEPELQKRPEQQACPA